jgi:hypothetical protein
LRGREQKIVDPVEILIAEKADLHLALTLAS